MDEWPQIRCPRFDGESLDRYNQRRMRIVEIVSNFRRGQYRGDEAERMENLLVTLREPELEYQ
ncbi:hypothetical protein [Devosia sp. 2618]|uniref:hypothetical protein n=1 Tax=Devosia sp. 2618 TaxID=3156454 RepID=UPI00339438FB